MSYIIHGRNFYKDSPYEVKIDFNGNVWGINIKTFNQIIIHRDYVPVQMNRKEFNSLNSFLIDFNNRFTSNAIEWKFDIIDCFEWSNLYSKSFKNTLLGKKVNYIDNTNKFLISINPYGKEYNDYSIIIYKCFINNEYKWLLNSNNTEEKKSGSVENMFGKYILFNSIDDIKYYFNTLSVSEYFLKKDSKKEYDLRIKRISNNGTYFLLNISKYEVSSDKYYEFMSGRSFNEMDLNKELLTIPFSIGGRCKSSIYYYLDFLVDINHLFINNIKVRKEDDYYFVELQKYSYHYFIFDQFSQFKVFIKELKKLYYG